MIEFTADRPLSSLRPLFPTDVPNVAILESVLNGTNAGHVILPARASRRWCVVMAAHHGFAFVGGAPTGAELTESIDALRRRGLVSFVAFDVEAWSSRGTSPPDREVARWEFSGRPPGLADPARRVPPDCVIRRIDHDLLARCSWRDAILGTYESADNYLARSVGFCLVRGADVLSEAHAVFRAPGVAEIGAITSPAERGRGLATATVARLVQECADLGAETVWSCDQDNDGSTGVARKLGYPRKRAYRLHEYLGNDAR